MHPKIVIIIPACNEATTIASVVRHGLDFGDVVVVDDFCTDNTADLASTAGASVLRLPFRMGAWSAVQAGMHYAARFQYDYYVTLDADAQHDPKDIQKLVQRVANDANTIAIGSDISRGSRARKFAWIVFRWLTRLPCADLTSGYRVYNQKTLPTLLSKKATLCEYQDIGILMLLKKNGFHFAEVNVSMRPRAVGASRIFSNWGTVFLYLMKTMVISLFSHFDTRNPCDDDWRCYGKR